MEKAYVLTGVLRDGRSLSLDETLPISTGRVRVTIEPVERTAFTPTSPAVLDDIWAGQRVRGHRPPTAQEVNNGVASERAAWN
jgi:hypothetical protein